MDTETIKIQIVELLRLEFEIEETISKQHQDLSRVKQQREMLEAQLKLIESGKISPEE